MKILEWMRRVWPTRFGPRAVFGMFRFGGKTYEG
jgi:hypothetical protein